MFFHFGHNFSADRMSFKLIMIASIVHPKIVSTGVSVCRTNDGHIVLSAHDGETRIMLDISGEECMRFADELIALTQQ